MPKKLDMISHLPIQVFGDADVMRAMLHKQPGCQQKRLAKFLGKEFEQLPTIMAQAKKELSKEENEPISKATK